MSRGQKTLQLVSPSTVTVCRDQTQIRLCGECFCLMNHLHGPSTDPRLAVSGFWTGSRGEDENKEIEKRQGAAGSAAWVGDSPQTGKQKTEPQGAQNISFLPSRCILGWQTKHFISQCLGHLTTYLWEQCKVLPRGPGASPQRPSLASEG